MKFVLILLIILLLILTAQRWFFSFDAQRSTEYSDTQPNLDVREALSGKMISEGIIYGPTGRVASRFVAEMNGVWDGDKGTLTEAFTYADNKGALDREWTLTMGTNGSFTATAPDIIGTGHGQQTGATVRMTYRIQLAQDAGGHVLDVVDWMYLMDNGTIINRRSTEMFRGRTYWIIGASEGLGKALAQALDGEGAELVLSARNHQRLAQVAGTLSNSRAVAMDVTAQISVDAAVTQVGEVDGVIYCAGLYEPMTAKEWNADAVIAMCDVNFMGAVRVLGHIAPEFARRRHGHIVMIGSLAGFRALSGAVGYSASKAAMMHLAENLYLDMRQTDVLVQQINPGFIKTRLTAKNEFSMPFIMTPEKAAKHVLRAMRSRRFQTSFPRPFSWLFQLSRFFPGALHRRIF